MYIIKKLKYFSVMRDLFLNTQMHREYRSNTPNDVKKGLQVCIMRKQ
jgi:hypothetical protein